MNEKKPPITQNSALLWTVQGLLAALFLLAGIAKLLLPADVLTKDTPMLSAAFLRFIGVLEVLGAAGLILPGLLKIRRELTWVAALGLTIIMIAATVITATGPKAATTPFPLITTLLTAFVAYGRRAEMKTARILGAAPSRF